MGDLRGNLKIFYTEKGGPEMLPEHRGENLKYLTSKNITLKKGGPEKEITIFWGDLKKNGNFHPSPPLINNEHSLKGEQHVESNFLGSSLSKYKFES